MEMKKFYVSLVKDLLDYYLEFEAESELAVRQYLMKEYWRDEQWTLPWCGVYPQVPDVIGTNPRVIKAKCGPLYEEQRGGGQ